MVTNPEIAKLLLRHGINPNLQSDKGETALHIAIQNANVEIVKILAPKTNLNLLEFILNKMHDPSLSFHIQGYTFILRYLKDLQNINCIQSDR